ncbi:ABC transporter permease [Halobaculum sp. EA56]|uniref:ABC transporter permease n=1 Tax=Halobaculum sp. EA56 TaxID=3421648 RepID=UPI003EBBA418
MSLKRYVASRLLQVIPTVIAIVTIVFFMVRFLPGSPINVMLGYAGGNEVVIERLKELYGLNRPVWKQYLTFLWQYAQLDFGYSIVRSRPIVPMIEARIPHTILLALGGTIIAVIIGVPAGIVSAVNRDTWVDDSVMITALLGVSTPSFWIGLMLILVFAVWVPIFPATGTGSLSSPVDILLHLVLPAITLGTFSASLIARITRSSMLDVLDSSYIQAAKARGIGERTVVYKHAFMNASIPVVTIVGLFLGEAIAGTIVIEVVFARTGIGRLLLDGIYSRDYPVVQATVLVIAVGYTLVNLVTDLTYAWLDPRIRY